MHTSFQANTRRDLRTRIARLPVSCVWELGVPRPALVDQRLESLMSIAREAAAMAERVAGIQETRK
ncbi:MAG: hypothetical protein ABI574_04665 [Burkholderiales bacterium]